MTSPGSAVKSKRTCRDFPGDPVVKTLCFSCRGAWVQSLVQKLRSHMPLSQEKKKHACVQSNSHGREGELAFCSWREGCRRTCGHILKSLQVLRLPQSKVLGEGELLSRGLPPPVPILRLDSGAHTGECAVLLSFQETAGCWPPLAPSPRTPNCCPVWCPRGRASRRTMLASSIFR